MTREELRAKALELASQDEKNAANFRLDGTTGTAAAVVARAQTYLDFLGGKVNPVAAKKRPPYSIR